MNRKFILQVGLLRWVWRYGCWQANKRVLRRDPTIRLPAHASYRCPRWDPFAAEVYVTRGNVDWGAEQLLAKLLQPEQVFLDVGAHTGYYAQFMAPHVAHVHLFEPDPRSFAWLQRHCESNRNFQLWNVAVGNTEGTMELCTDGRGFSHNDGNGTVYRVRTLRLDTHLELFGNVGAIKIDIDGPDMDVLYGAEHLTTRHRPLILLEIGNFLPDPLARWLAKHDYQLLAFRQPHGLRLAGLDQVAWQPWEPERMKMVLALPTERVPEAQAAARICA